MEKRHRCLGQDDNIGHGWYYDADSNSKVNAIATKKENTRSANNGLRFCVIHKGVWQKSYTGRGKIDCYDEFPSFGLKRKICPDCEKLTEEKL